MGSQVRSPRRLSVRSRLISTISLLAILASASFAADAPGKVDPRYPFRTDFANAQLPWYMPKAGEFPPHHSDRRIGGELVSIDAAHRSGKFRRPNGEVIEFTMPPYGSVNYLYSDAALSDVPPGTFFLFFLNQDAQGNWTRLATMQDQFTMDAGHAFAYTVVGIDLPGGKLTLTKHFTKKSETLPPNQQEWLVDDATRVWKDDKQVKLADLALKDEILFNFTNKPQGKPGHCTDIWIGTDTAKHATEQERTKFATSMKAAGLPAWIDSVDGNKIVATLFTGDPGTFRQTYMSDFAVKKEIKVVSADDLLQTATPPVDAGSSTLLNIKPGPVDAYGTSGIQLTFTVSNPGDAFSKGHIVRIFAPGWTKGQ